MKVIDIVKNYMDEVRVRGLGNATRNCSCQKDNLAPCGSVQNDCTVAPEDRIVLEMDPPVSTKLSPDDIDCGYSGTSTVDVAHDGIMAQTQKAVLFSIGGDEHWVPKSCIYSVDGREAQLATWFAEKEGLA